MSLFPPHDGAAVRELVSGRCVLMMGASGAGKSTLAAQLAGTTGAVVVSYDGHQRQVAGDTGIEPVGDLTLTKAWTELEGHCAAGRPVIMDGTHCQPQRREKVRAVAAAYGLETVVVVLLVPLEVCLAQQRLRGRRVPDKDVIRQHEAIVTALPLLAGEGHAAVIGVRSR
ncbi:AAA family ATPase [Streptomyces sp. NPDC091972]|uniref:AAA family ATPase n=1 Tax=Streptomyces sp. NPDC091972 TaxID=3366007 RepID=UPI0038166F08